MVTWRRLLGWAAIAAVVEYALVTALAKEVIPPLIVIGLIIAVGAFLLRRPGRAGVIVSLVGFVIFLLSNIVFAAIDLMAPASLPSFALAGAAVVTGVVGVVAAIAALRGGGESPAARKVGIAAAGVSVLLLAANVAASATYTEPTRGGGDVSVVAKDSKWDTERLTAPAGRVTFFADNKDPSLHNFRVKGVGVFTMPASKAASGTFDVKAGTYEYVCDVHPDTMTGTLTVT